MSLSEQIDGFLHWAGLANRLNDSHVRFADSSFREMATDLAKHDLVLAGEAVHGAAEVLEFRNELFQHLVENHGFAAIALESGFAEGRLLHDYVLGRRDDLDVVLGSGIGWGMHRAPQNRRLVQWIRSRNERSDRKVAIYGFDITGSPGSSHGIQAHGRALGVALDFLERVDSDAAASLRMLAGDFATELAAVPFGDTGVEGYHRLSGGERQRLSDAAHGLCAQLANRSYDYAALGGLEDFWWARLTAQSAVHMDQWLQALAACGPARTDATAFRAFAAATGTRDAAQAEVLRAIVAREAKNGGVFAWAANVHMSLAPLSVRFSPESPWFFHKSAGSLLKAAFDGRIAALGCLVGGGEVGCDGYREVLRPPAAMAIEAMLASVGIGPTLLKLGRAPEEARAMLREKCFLSAGGQQVALRLDQAFDHLAWFPNVSPTDA